MPRLRWIVPFVIVVAAAAALATASDPPPLSVAGVDAIPLDDPFPLRRIRVREDQLGEAQKQLDVGPLVRMPRAGFEARVRAASATIAATRSVPRLAEASYTAVLSGDDLSGDARWELVNPGDRPAAFAMDPFRLAVRDATWADGQPAIVGVVGAGFPTAPAVWMETGGRQSLRLKWSASGTRAGGDRRYELRLPPCPIATFDLTLPDDYVPTLLSTDAILIGPLPQPKQPKSQRQRTWRFRFGGRSALDFAVRGPGNSSSTNPVRGSLAAKYDFTPGQVACAFEYDLLPTRGSVREWVFDVDPGLRVIDAVTFNRAGPVRYEPGIAPDLPGKLRIGLRQSGIGGKVLITAFASPSSGPLPMVRPVGALLGEERIEVRIPLDLRLGGWMSGDYRLAEDLIGIDQTRRLTWVGSLLPPGHESAFRRPPVVRTGASAVEFTTREAVEWRSENGYFVLSVRVNVRVRRGPLFGMTLRTPPGYEPRRASAGTDDVLSFVGNAPSGPHGLVAEFARPLAAGQQVELRFELRGPPLPALAGKSLRVPFPRVEPVGASEREGWVALGPVPGWGAAADLTSGPLPAADATRSEPPVPADAIESFAFRGREPEGWIVLTAIRPVFATETTVVIRADGSRWLVTTRFDITVGAGAVSAVTVFVPKVGERTRTWAVSDESNAVASAVPIDPGAFDGAEALFAAATDLRAALVRTGAAGEVPWLHGTYWVVTFAHPLTGRATLETTDRVALPDNGDRPVSLPRLILCGTDPIAPQVEFAPPLTGRAEPRSTDILVVRRPTAEASPTATECTFGGLTLVTTVGADHVEAAFGGTVSGPAGSTFPLTLPTGAELRSVSVGGHWLGPSIALNDSIRIPIPMGNATAFEVRYRLPADGGSWRRRVRSPVPELPGGSHPIVRQWAISADVLPIGSDFQPHHAAGDSLLAISTGRAEAFAFALTALIAALTWIGARRFPVALGVIAIVPITASGLAVLFGSSGWDAVALPPLIASLTAFAAASAVRGWIRPRKPALTALAVAGSLAFAVHAQPPAADTVLLVGPDETALVPQTLLDRLDAAAKRPAPAAIVTAAAFEGRVEDGLARVAARFTATSFGEGETVIALPLADIRLESATVDEKPSFPIAVRPDLYSFVVSGRGRHSIEVRFAVPVASTGSEREVKFGIPEIPATKLGLSVRGSADQLQAVGCIGAHRLAASDGAVRIDADLGSIRTVQVRWRQALSGRPEATYREACVWDVSESEAELNACYQVKIERGSIGQFRIDVPAELEATRVSVRSADASATAPPVLRDWTLGPEKDGFRPLVLNLTGPTDGRLTITLECVPCRAPTLQPVLRFPRLNTPMVKPVANGTYFAFRANAVAVEGRTPTGTIDLPPDELLFHFGDVADLKLDATAKNLKVFRPVSAATRAEFRPLLRAGPEPAALSAETTWRVGPSRADVAGTMRWQAVHPITVAEFDLSESRVFGTRIPHVVVSEVRGADVAGWAQLGGRVQVWLRKPVREPAIEWVGRAAHSARTPTSAGPVAFAASSPHSVGGSPATLTLRVRPDADAIVRMQPTAAWKPATPNPGREWAFTTNQIAPPVRVDLFPPGIAGPTRGFGLIDASKELVVYRATVEVPLRTGRPHRLAVSASGLPLRSATELELPPGTTVAEERSEDGRRVWIVETAPTTGAALRATVVVRFSIAAGAVRLPAVSAGPVEAGNDPDGAIRWIGLARSRPGTTLVGATSAGLSDVRAAWPGEAERLRLTGGSVWEVRPGAAPPQLNSDRAAPNAALLPPLPKAATAVREEETTPSLGTSTRTVNWPAVVWLAALALLFALFIAFPRTTWPEQLALAAALFGTAVVGGWWLGLAVEAAARTVWLVRWVRFSRQRVEL